MKEVLRVLKYKEMIRKAFAVEVKILICKRKKGHEKVNGYYRDRTKTIVIYHSKDMVKTLLHELTHAFQYKYMKYMMEDETLYRTTRQDNYWDRPIERHARLAANSIMKHLDKNGIDSIQDLDVYNTLFLLDQQIIKF